MVRKFLLTAAVAVAALLTPASSRADYTLTMSAGSNGSYSSVVVLDFTTQTGTVNGGPSQSFASLEANDDLTIINESGGKWFVSSSNTTGLVLNATIAYSNSPGTVLTGLLNLANVTVADTGVMNADASIVLSSTGYTAPASPRLVETTYNANLQNDSSTASLTDETTYSDTSVGTITMPSETGTVSSPLSTVPLYSSNIYSNAIYTLTDSMIFALNGYDNISGNIYSNVYQIAPAPSSLILAATMVPFFGLLRRRMQGLKTAAVA